jgi:hypothetical protein
MSGWEGELTFLARGLVTSKWEGSTFLTRATVSSSTASMTFRPVGGLICLMGILLLLIYVKKSSTCVVYTHAYRVITC